MKINQKKGFGLLEVLLAGVMIIMILSALLVVTRNVSDNAVQNQQRLQATYLAQEGIEIVRQIRDSNYIDQNKNTRWDTLIGDSSNISFISNNGKVTDNDYVITKNMKNQRYRLIEKIDTDESANGIIELDGTKFTRKINFIEYYGTLDKVGVIDNPPLMYQDEIVENIPAVKVRVEVGWMWKTGKSNDKKIVIEELITDFRQGI